MVCIINLSKQILRDIYYRRPFRDRGFRSPLTLGGTIRTKISPTNHFLRRFHSPRLGTAEDLRRGRPCNDRSRGWIRAPRLSTGWVKNPAMNWLKGTPNLKESQDWRCSGRVCPQSRTSLGKSRSDSIRGEMKKQSPGVAAG